MAKLLLEPKETFEHFHIDDSSTTLIKGKAKYQCEDIVVNMELNKPVYTPGMKSHIIENIGRGVCVLDCNHGSGGKS